MNNTAVKSALESWEEQGKQLVEELQGRLDELEEERAEIQAQIAKITGQPVSQPNGKRRYVRTGVNIKEIILQILEEAGNAGLTAGQIVAGVRAESDKDVERSNIVSHLHRLKENKGIRVTGAKGAYVYKTKARS